VSHPKNVLVIMGSVRARRVCRVVTQWVVGLGRTCAEIEFEIVDLADWPLPLDDEPEIPATGIYTQPHTRDWSAKIAAADAVIFVTPQYNWGYPAPLKNAIDHIHGEWRDKPAMLVTYGGHGGTKCAEQLRQVLGAVKARLVPTAPALVLPDAVIRAGDALVPDRDFASHVPAVREALTGLCAQLAASPV
jgi:NAD(P)H-dependent FMN reductase